MATPFELTLDLEDGLPPATVEVGAKPPKGGGTPGAHPTSKGLPEIIVTSTPVAVTASYAEVFCQCCHDSMREFRGLFLESRLSNGVRVLARKTLRELAQFKELPRRVDHAPSEVIEICPECFINEEKLTQMFAAAQVQGELELAQAPEAQAPVALSVSGTDYIPRILTKKQPQLEISLEDEE